MAGEKVTSRDLTTTAALDDVSHIVNVADTSQDAAGSSYKIKESTRFTQRGLSATNNNISATAAPTVTDDSSLNYTVGSLWFFSGVLYVCQDASVGAAVWTVFQSGISGVWTPTISNETNCTVSLSEWNFIKVGNAVNFGGFLRVDIDGGQTSGSFNLDLATLIIPDNNWTSNTDLNATISRTNGVLTSECTLVADSSGNKLIDGFFSDTSTGESIRVAVQGSFVTNN